MPFQCYLYIYLRTSTLHVIIIVMEECKRDSKDYSILFIFRVGFVIVGGSSSSWKFSILSFSTWRRKKKREKEWQRERDRRRRRAKLWTFRRISCKLRNLCTVSRRTIAITRRGNLVENRSCITAHVNAKIKKEVSKRFTKALLRSHDRNKISKCFFVPHGFDLSRKATRIVSK